MMIRSGRVASAFCAALLGIVVSGPASAAPAYVRMTSTWDPCQSIGWIYSDAFDSGSMTFPHFHQEVVNAMNRLGQLTGLRFVAKGSTHAEPDPKAFVPSSDIQVIIGRGWTSGPEAAGTTWTYADRTRPTHTAGAVVVFDQGNWTSMTDQIPTIRHELGHAVGLGHVQDPNDLMYSGPNRAQDYSAGDLAGLKAVGRRGACP